MENLATDKQTLVNMLSERSKEVLDALKQNRSITREDWSHLLGDLKDAGAITQGEFDFASFRIVGHPVGEKRNGEFVPYQPGDLGFLDIKAITDQVNKWPANPFEHLDTMGFLLRKMRNVLMVQERQEQKGFTFSGFYKQENAYTKVANLVKDLIA
ncbi:hypothetical protein [Pseudoflavonifractor sp. 524-17]|uniref:hypothetical protein n=1 Tax=Pseudoflavonifractor sp. 524-17 TaxID=2304577 RepID=UPI00137A5ACE|nr:hypothetical protein [Pseudoflavonifractor sp. 524-17]